jgi:hypothetical protein
VESLKVHTVEVESRIVVPENGEYGERLVNRDNVIVK